MKYDDQYFKCFYLQQNSPKKKQVLCSEATENCPPSSEDNCRIEYIAVALFK